MFSGRPAKDDLSGQTQWPRSGPFWKFGHSCAGDLAHAGTMLANEQLISFVKRLDKSDDPHQGFLNFSH